MNDFMVRSLRAACVASTMCLSVLGLFRGTVARGEELRRADVERLFQLAWSTASEDRSEVAPYYEQLSAKSGGDARLRHARLLTAIKLRQYADAAKMADVLTAVDKPALDHLRARVWLSVLLKNYGQASVAMEKLLAALPPLADPPADDEGDFEELSRFLGRVQGFLDGPVADAVPEAQRNALRKKITEGLSGERKVAFLEGRQAVLDQFLALTDAKETRREKTKEAGERERDERLQSLNDSREQAAERAKELDSRKSKLRSELNDELAQLQKQDAPLARRFAQLDAQGTALRRDLALIDSDRLRYDSLLAREKDPNLRASYIRELARLDALFARLDVDFAAVTRQAASVAAQRADLDRRAAQARLSAGQQVDAADREQADLNRKARRADAEEKRLKTKTPGEKDVGVLAKAAQAAAFTTYEPYPLDEQRQVLLDSFK